MLFAHAEARRRTDVSVTLSWIDRRGPQQQQQQIEAENTATDRARWATDPDGVNRVDLATADLDADLERLAGLARASHRCLADLEKQRSSRQHVGSTLADPEGNEFDVVQTGG